MCVFILNGLDFCYIVPTMVSTPTPEFSKDSYDLDQTTISTVDRTTIFFVQFLHYSFN